MFLVYLLIPVLLSARYYPPIFVKLSYQNQTDIRIVVHASSSGSQNDISQITFALSIIIPLPYTL